MRKVLRVFAVSVSAVALVLSGTAVASAKSRGPVSYTCTSGDIPSGNYANLRVTGACDVPDNAVIKVVGGVYVGTNAELDAQNAPSTITVGGDVIAAPGSLVGLGCQPDGAHSEHACTVDPNGHSTVTIRGNVIALGADTILLNGITVKSSVTLAAGGGAIPWSIKNDTIRGNLTVIGVKADWLGVLFNSIGGNVTLVADTVTEPGSQAYVVENTVNRNLVCLAIAPSVSGGFIPGEVNTVGGRAIGQCASLV